MPDSARLVTSSEVARELGVARQTVARWVREGVITPAVVTAGGQGRFNIEEVKRQLREHGQRQRNDGA
ncbi:MerR family transcriptional regulator [Saccharopolyspora thermophila]|uniref:MerR family transcriptional regulator n=1 Tax=Saccharopolyspora thermophila TaxID=89367 RepID=UPI0031FA2DA3